MYTQFMIEEENSYNEKIDLFYLLIQDISRDYEIFHCIQSSSIRKPALFKCHAIRTYLEIVESR